MLTSLLLTLALGFSAPADAPPPSVAVASSDDIRCVIIGRRLICIKTGVGARLSLEVTDPLAGATDLGV